MDGPTPPAPLEIAPPPPLPEDGEIMTSPVSCQLSPRGKKRVDIDNDDGGKQSPPTKQRRTESSAEEMEQGAAMMIEHADLQVIDDIECSDGEEGGQEKQNGDVEDDDDDDDDWDEGEIDALLDEGVKDYKEKKEESARPTEREKIVLIDRCQELFDVLPEDWVMFTHDSGMPIYLHRPSRVVSLARPYFLGKASARKHEVPLCAIPCLQYRRALDKEKEEAEKKAASAATSETVGAGESVAAVVQNGTADVCPVSPVSAVSAVSAVPDGDKAAEKSVNGAETPVTGGEKPSGCPFAAGAAAGAGAGAGKRDIAKEVASTVIATAEEYRKENSVDPLTMRKYCENLFQFKSITVKRFKTWKDKRKYFKKANRPTLPATTQFITRPVPLDIGGDKPIKKVKEFMLNPVGKSDMAILHEYLQQTMQIHPKFTYAEIENSQTPYSCTVSIDGGKYGVGYGGSKKAAKNDAASKTLEILLPELKGKLKSNDPNAKNDDPHDLAFFDEIKIEDRRVSDLCNKASLPNPYSILIECIRRNHGLCDMEISSEMNVDVSQKSEFIMRVGKHEAKVIVKNKREGKQLAAQKILQLLHPHVHCWGSLLRLYGTPKHHKERDEEEAEMDDMDSVRAVRKSSRQTGKRSTSRGRSRGGSPRSMSGKKAFSNPQQPPKALSEWQLHGEDGEVVEFSLMEYGALGELEEEESEDVPLPVLSPDYVAFMFTQRSMPYCSALCVSLPKSEQSEMELPVPEVKVKVEAVDVNIQTHIKEEKLDVATQVYREIKEKHIQAKVEQRNAATGPAKGLVQNANIQAVAKMADKLSGYDRAFALTQDAGFGTGGFLPSSLTAAALKLRNANSQAREVQTVLKGWQSACLDVSVQQSNGSFRVQSLDVNVDDLSSPVNRPLRIWFPPNGKDVVCQTDIKGWVDTHMDVITQGEDGSYYLKKSQEHSAQESDLIYRPYRVHRAVQATWVGRHTFHMATQTKWDGSSTFHKATQFPDPQKSEEQMGQSVLYTLDKGCPVGLVPTLTPFTSAPTVTSLLATLGLPSTEDAPIVQRTVTSYHSTTNTPSMMTTSRMSEFMTTPTSSVTTTMSYHPTAQHHQSAGGEAEMDIDAESSPSNIEVSQGGDLTLASTSTTSSVPSLMSNSLLGTPPPGTVPPTLPAGSLAGITSSSGASTSVVSSLPANAITNADGDRIMSASAGSIANAQLAANASLMSFAGYNQFNPAQQHVFLPPNAPATFPMQPYGYFPQFPSLPPGYNFYPGWM